MLAIVLTATFVALLWARLAVRSILLAKQSPRLTKTDTMDFAETDLPKVIAIVPAHNEQAGVAETIEGILTQNWPADKLQLIVVDDQSTDQTATVLKEIHDREPSANRLTILTGASRPPGWAGKTWAVHQGVEAVDPSIEWLWMVDSDMKLSPNALAVAYSEACRTSADLVSLTAGVDARSVAQKATSLAMIHLLWQLYPLPHVNNPARPEALAHGAFLLIKREIYDRIGGMESLRQEIIEDIRLAQRVKSSGGVLAVRGAPDLTRTDFYGNLKDILNGLRKNAYAGMDYMPHKFWTGLVFGIIFTWLPLITFLLGITLSLTSAVSVATIAMTMIGMIGMIFQAQSLLPIVIYLGIPKYYAFSLSLGGSIYMWACCLSVLDYYRGRVVWRGRNFEIDKLHSKEADVRIDK